MTSEVASAMMSPMKARLHIAFVGVTLTGFTAALGCAKPAPARSSISIKQSENYKQVDVVLVDGDTGERLPGLQVYTPRGEWGVEGDTAVTDANGRATLRIHEYVGRGVGANPDGYLRSVMVSAESPIEEPLMVKVYRPPEPLAGLTVPTGYRGVLRVRLWDHGDPSPEPPSDGPPWMDGKREFFTPADVDGVTQLEAPPELTHQPYDPTVRIARFADGTPLRFENPTWRSGWSGEHVYGLSQVRDRVPPREDGVVLFHLGLHTTFAPTTRPGLRFEGDFERLYFVGTLDAARAEQQRLLEGASELPKGEATTSGYAFRPEPLDLATIETGEQGGPRLK